MPSLGPISAGALDRRAILRLIAAGATTALAGCSKPDEPIYPRAVDQEGADPGAIRRYATALPLGGYLRGATGIVVDGRPIKLEGLDGHPASLGATDLFTEAAILDLYDPQRLRAPVGPNDVSGWGILAQALVRATAGSDGAGLRLLTGRTTSPTMLARIADMTKRFPGMRHTRFEAIDDDNERAGAQAAFGRPLTIRPRLADADVVLALDADPLGPGPEQVALARAWATRRLAAGGPQRLFVLEPSMTQTGACADRRAAATPGQVADALLALANALGGATAFPTLPQPVATLLAAATRALQGARGRALVLVGRSQPPAVHALAHWVNARLAAPVDAIAPVDPDPTPHGASLAGLAAEMHAGRVSALVMVDVDPLYHAPSSLDLAAALARVPLSVAATRFPNETSRRATWSAPLSHPLESWADGRAPDGTASIAQPLIRPLYRTRSPLEMLDLVDPTAAPMSAYDRLRTQWQSNADGDFEHWWQAALLSGTVPKSTAAKTALPDPKLTPYPPSGPSRGIVIALAPSPNLWDGRMATNAWAQECPDPITKEVWGASLRIAQADAARMGIDDGSVVALGAAGDAAVRIEKGQAVGIATLLLGHGRQDSGVIATTPGANGFRLRGSAGGWLATGVAIHPTGRHRSVTTTQHQFALDGDLAKLFPVVAPGEALPPAAPQATLLPRRQPASNAPPQWAMVIDTAVCIGCNACVIACQAENNVPAIGPDEMAVGRDMHWLRIDRYDRGADAADPRPGFQPVPCMQCETAPCEPVCPVEASVHDEQGLNVQVYNRCVGTRTCQANCPYKVRRFNFLDYAGADLWQEDDHGSVTAQRNPDVSVRARGVMEKCTYCVQRIERAEHDAAADGSPLDPAIVRTACESACPTRAITFGALGEPEIAAARADKRHYGLLAELGTRPRTTYLAKLKAEDIA